MIELKHNGLAALRNGQFANDTAVAVPVKTCSIVGRCSVSKTAVFCHL